MTPVILALAPVFLVILLGWALRARLVKHDAFWRGADTLVYFILFPALLVVQVAQADLVAGLRAATTAMGATLALALLLTLTVRPWAKRLYGRPTYSSIFQGGVRFQSFIGVGAALALLGPAGAAAFAVVIGFCIPTINVLCVLVLSIDGDGAKPTPLGVLRALAQNPLILAGAFGAALNLADLQPRVLLDALDILAAATLPIGLLAVGAGLELTAIKRGGMPLLIASLAKFVAMPALVLGCAALTGLSGPAAQAALLYAALPTAATSYVLARRMGGDAPTMAALAAAQAAIAAIALPLWFALGV